MSKKKETKKETVKKTKRIPVKHGSCTWCGAKIDKVPLEFCSDECRETYVDHNPEVEIKKAKAK